jgi:glycosyl transferase family 25
VEVFYINLKRRPDRRDRFLAMNAGAATFRRAEAADGQLLARDQLFREGIIADDDPPDYSPGAFGCAISHKRLWEMGIASSAALTLAEDDGVVNKHFSQKASTLLARLPSHWDIILWGWNFDSILHVDMFDGLQDAVLHFGSAQLGERQTDFQARNYDVAAFRLLSAFGTISYSISPSGAKRLRDLCFPLKQDNIEIPGLRRNVTNLGIDIVLNKHYRELRAYACFPPLVWTENDKTRSDIW